MSVSPCIHWYCQETLSRQSWSLIPEVEAVRTSSTCGVPLIVGLPVAALLVGGASWGGSSCPEVALVVLVFFGVVPG